MGRPLKKYDYKWNGTPEDWGKGHYRDIPWSNLVILTRQRHINDLKRSAANDADFPYYFDWAESERAVKFIEKQRHIDGEWAGKPFILSDWQEWDVVRPLLGWKRRDGGGRRYRDAFISVARKNGKSSLIAAIANYLFMADKEFGAQVYAAATKEEQARIVWEMSRKMIEFSPELRGEIKSFKRSFVSEHLGARFMPLGRDSKTMDGFSVHCGVIDEYHAHKTSQMYDVIDDARGARRQPLLLIITTAGFEISSPCKKEWDLGVKILKGILKNDTYYVFIASVDDPEKWMDEAEWWKANPNMGISIYIDGFKKDFDKAWQSPQKQNSFKTKRLNTWTEQATRWISMQGYSKCDGPLDIEALRGKRCFGGLDLGLSGDISAFALAFMDTEMSQGEQNIYVLMRYWIPEVGKFRRSEIDGVNYIEWAEQGWISTTPGERTRNDMIRRDINELREIYEVAEIASDPAHGHELLQDLSDDGATIIKHGQGFTAMHSPCTEVEKLITTGRFKHGNDPVLRWMFSNAAIRQDSQERIRVYKPASGDRVDGVTAVCMAVGRLMIAPEPVKSVYVSRGLVVL